MILVFLAIACGTPAEPEAVQPPPVCSPVAPASPATAAPVAADTAPAEAAALSWLALVDGGSYGDSYDQAAAFFRSSLPRDAWVTAVTGARAPLGSAGARVLLSATPMKDPDGTWRVSGYFIK